MVSFDRLLAFFLLVERRERINMCPLLWLRQPELNKIFIEDKEIQMATMAVKERGLSVED